MRFRLCLKINFTRVIYDHIQKKTNMMGPTVVFRNLHVATVIQTAAPLTYSSVVPLVHTHTARAGKINIYSRALCHDRHNILMMQSGITNYHNMYVNLIISYTEPQMSLFIGHFRLYN